MGEIIGAILAAAAIIGALIVIGRTGVWLWGVLRKLARLADDLTGEPPRAGFPEGRPGLLDRVAAIEGSLATLVELDNRLRLVEEAVARPAPASVDVN